MSSTLKYQLRITVTDPFAETARRDPSDPSIEPLRRVLERHRASLKCQYDAFADYVAEAEREGIDRYPLYAWTRATIENPVKKAKYLKSFALYVEGDEVYSKDKADPLEEDLRPLAGGEIVKQIFKFDTDPARNPQPPARYRT